MSLVDAAMIASGFLASAGIVWGALVKLGKRGMRLERAWTAFWGQWNGQAAEDGRAAVPGVMARLAAVETHLRQQDEHLTEQDKQIAALAGKTP